MRYYPKDRTGNLDEWGAVIKHQSEMYKQEEQKDQIHKKSLQRDYYNELQRAQELKNKQSEFGKVQTSLENNQLAH